MLSVSLRCLISRRRVKLSNRSETDTVVRVNSVVAVGFEMSLRLLPETSVSSRLPSRYLLLVFSQFTLFSVTIEIDLKGCWLSLVLDARTILGGCGVHHVLFNVVADPERLPGDLPKSHPQ